MSTKAREWAIRVAEVRYSERFIKERYSYKLDSILRGYLEDDTLTDILYCLRAQREHAQKMARIAAGVDC